MAKVIVTANEYSTKTPREKVTAVRATGTGISGATSYFPDGNTVATAATNAGNNLETALDAYDANPSQTNGDLANDAEKDSDLAMDNCVIYVQGKCNAAPDFDTASAMAHAAALGVKKKGTKQPVPDPVTDAEAEFSNIPNTMWVKLKKKPKYSKYFEVRVSTNPDDPSSWKLWDTFAGKKILLDSLISGQKYYIKVTACNNSGKSIASTVLEQIAA